MYREGLDQKFQSMIECPNFKPPRLRLIFSIPGAVCVSFERPNCLAGACDSQESQHLQARKRDININFLVQLLLGRPQACPGQTRLVPGTKWVCPGQTQVLSLFTQCKPSLSQGQTQFVPGTIPGTKGGRRVCVKSVCPFFTPDF